MTLRKWRPEDAHTQFCWKRETKQVCGEERRGEKDVGLGKGAVHSSPSFFPPWTQRFGRTHMLPCERAILSEEFAGWEGSTVTLTSEGPTGPPCGLRTRTHTHTETRTVHGHAHARRERS